MKHCQWCDSAFTSNISYQIYCSPDCRELATKEKIAERYAQLRIKKRRNKDRRCRQCTNKLSAYNDGPLCSACTINFKEVNDALKDIKGLSDES